MKTNEGVGDIGQIQVKVENGNRRENVKVISTLIRVVVCGICLSRWQDIFWSTAKMAGSMMGLITWSRVVVDVQGMTRRVIPRETGGIPREWWGMNGDRMK